jgi:rod shape-determining protein MreD
MSRSLGKDIFIALLFLVLQLTIFRHLSIFGSTADLILLFVFWLASVSPRSYTLIFAAAIGFLQDAFLDIWGINMFSKVFIALVGYSFIQNMTQSKPFISQVMGTVLALSFVHNLVFLGIAAITSDYNISANFFQISIGNSLYTALLGSLIYLFKKEE